ncbi:hypothetical protein VCHA50O413_10903 [Vibrio chagasii]|nr:hypothetical protein VCHA50P417_130091 [Vibrio chagasii]CAH6992077.1 hypothetical protein VCHA48P442_130090 [Vibrio chagasii]CAH7013810.1 hypothetical protein VCHA50O409_10904 [Vibrio chagasii]CAH7048416.1 hypothetical protein VCHA53O466_180090 [Vibrio chagasii]CAH7050260.1 hypothetical protein VCHA50O402_10904 [Vibrio chagasii]
MHHYTHLGLNNNKIINIKKSLARKKKWTQSLRDLELGFHL